jgi:hypothetical protein
MPYGITNILFFNTNPYIQTDPVGANVGQIALVSLVRASSSDPSPTRELVEEIRKALQSSAISNTWTIEKITVLEESEAAASSQRTWDVARKTTS